MNYSDDGMKVVHERGLAWSTDKKQKNVEWDVLPQAMFLTSEINCGKNKFENDLCDPDLGFSST